MFTNGGNLQLVNIIRKHVYKLIKLEATITISIILIDNVHNVFLGKSVAKVHQGDPQLMF
jgi:hypothetical protein